MSKHTLSSDSFYGHVADTMSTFIHACALEIPNAYYIFMLVLMITNFTTVIKGYPNEKVNVFLKYLRIELLLTMLETSKLFKDVQFMLIGNINQNVSII